LDIEGSYFLGLQNDIISLKIALSEFIINYGKREKFNDNKILFIYSEEINPNELTILK